MNYIEKEIISKMGEFIERHDTNPTHLGIPKYMKDLFKDLCTNKKYYIGMKVEFVKENSIWIGKTVYMPYSERIWCGKRIYKEPEWIYHYWGNNGFPPMPFAIELKIIKK